MPADPINVVIDLSHNNRKADFAAIKTAGILAVIHKATQGARFVDTQYAIRRKQAAAHGLLWGAYHFGTGSADGITQAKHFLDIAKPDANTLVTLDFEENSVGQSSMTLEQARQFVNFIHDTLKRFPVLYGGSFLKRKLGKKPDPVLANCALWYAQYLRNTPPRIPPNWSTWTMWQYTDGKAGDEPHTVPGLGACDRDRFNGNVDALRALWGAVPALV